MPVIPVSVEQIVRTGLEATYTEIDDADGVEFTNDGATFVHVKSNDANTVLTIVTPYTIEGDLGLDDREYTLAADLDEVFLGPFSRTFYNDGAGKMNIKSSKIGIGTAPEIAVLKA